MAVVVVLATGEVGRISPAEHDAAHAIALEAIADLDAGRPPFVEDAWPAVPREYLQPVTDLPVGWNSR